jgi:general stress protein 26
MNEGAVEIPLAADVKRVQELASGCEVLFLVAAGQGALARAPARPMRLLQIDDAGVAWFFLDTEMEAGRDVSTPVNVTLAWHDLLQNRWVSAEGRTRVVNDRARIGQLWTPEHTAWMPAGLATPGLALLAVDLERVSWWKADANLAERLLARVRARLGRPRKPFGLSRGCIDLRLTFAHNRTRARPARAAAAKAAAAEAPMEGKHERVENVEVR